MMITINPTTATSFGLAPRKSSTSAANHLNRCAYVVDPPLVPCRGALAEELLRKPREPVERDRTVDKAKGGLWEQPLVERARDAGREVLPLPKERAEEVVEIILREVVEKDRIRGFRN